jgi:hypothetical protein
MSYSNNCYSSNSSSDSSFNSSSGSSSSSSSGGYTFYSNAPPTISYIGLSNYSCGSYPSKSIYGSGGSTYSSGSFEVDGGSVSHNHIGISDDSWDTTAEFLCDQVDDVNGSFNNFLTESQGDSKSKKKNPKLSDFANQRPRDKGKFTKK